VAKRKRRPIRGRIALRSFYALQRTVRLQFDL
jgi:hypothetical protein